MELQATIFQQLCKIKDKSKSDFGFLERWPSYYDRRFIEFVTYMDIAPNPNLGRVLELGCGNGYQSALLSVLSDEVVATDLKDESMETHTPGMKNAMTLLEGLQIRNVSFIPCSAEDLPFPDDNFDTVFSSHVTEHVPNQEIAIREIFRVLKPGGIFFCIVPSSFDKPYAIMNYYLYLFSRIPSFLIKKGGKKKNLDGITEDSNQIVSTEENALNSFKKHFPFPPPHGAYPNFKSEFIDWTPANWKKKLMSTSPFELIDQRTTQFLPFMPFLGYLVPSLGTKFHSLTRKFERKIGKNRIVQFFGINSVIVLRKISA